MEKTLEPAVFLDRDGTINIDSGYISRPEDLVLIEGAARAIKALNEAGLKVIVITNQSGVARGYYDHEALDAVNRRLSALLSREGARFDALYYCPHHPDESCGCRKPATGLVERAAREHGIDTTRSFVVGDKATDMELARNIGVRGVLVLTGRGLEERELSDADFVAPDLAAAVRWIMDEIKEGGPCLR